MKNIRIVIKWSPLQVASYNPNSKILYRDFFFQVRFVMDESTTLADLLSLNLHNFEDDVRGIVDKAVKEMSMEKVLKELDATWTTMEFEHEPHPRTKITMLKTSEELIETLEDNQVCIEPGLKCSIKQSFL